MKKATGWFLTVTGGLLCVSAVVVVPAAFTAEGLSLGQRIVMLLCFLLCATAAGALCRFGLRLKAPPAIDKEVPQTPPKKPRPRREADPELEQKCSAARAEIRKLYQEFLEGEGKLPRLFSDPYSTALPGRPAIRRTPFESYLSTIRKQVDNLRDQSGISDWIHLEDAGDLSAAAQAIAAWAARHREITDQLRQKCHIGNTTIMLPVFPSCTGKVMVVADDNSASEALTPEILALCKQADIAFCTLLSDRSLYDWTDRKVKEIAYTTYPNYHDETYADWYFV